MAKNRGDKGSSSYLVGFGKPPIHSRFKKGQSGNPSGRRKGTLNLATVLLATLHEKVTVNENGKRKRISKLEASVKQLVNKAASGDLRALAQLIAITSSAEHSANQEAGRPEIVDELDKKVVLNFLRRCQATEEVTKDEDSSK